MSHASKHALVEPTAGAAQVADILRNRIIRGEIQAGDRLVERQLSAQLNVSRTPIREALKLLQVDGLIEILPFALQSFGHCFVSQPSPVAATAR